MYKFPIGVIVDSFRLPLKEAVAAAASIGAQGLQMYAWSGAMSPEELTPEKRRELRSMVEGYGLKFSALCGDSGHGFANAEINPMLIEKSKRVVDLALDLGTNVVTTHIGVVPNDENHPRFQVMAEACRQLAEYSDSVGAHFAVETGPETGKVLRKFLDCLGSKGVGVNLDPANLVMVAGDDPAKAVRELKDYIVHTHAKDGIMLVKSDPEFIYGVKPMPEGTSWDTYFREVPLGTGGVNWSEYLKALDEIGYRGYLTIEREVGENPAADIKTAVTFLNEVMKNN